MHGRPNAMHYMLYCSGYLGSRTIVLKLLLLLLLLTGVGSRGAGNIACMSLPIFGHAMADSNTHIHQQHSNSQLMCQQHAHL